MSNHQGKNAMIVPAKINYIKALKVTGAKFVCLVLLTGLINQGIEYYQCQTHLIPEKFIILMSSALGIFLGFRINAAYSRWRDGHGIFRDLMSTCLSFMAQLTVLSKSKSDSDLYSLKYNSAIILLRYMHLVRLELLKAQPEWRNELKTITFNKTPLFPDKIISNIADKKRKGSYLLSQLSKLIHQHDFITTGELAKSLQQMIVLEQTMVSLKYTPFPWGYQFYTRLFVWILPLLFIFSTLNQLTFIDNIVLSFIGTIFITTEQVAKNLDDPITGSYNGVPFNSLCRVLEIELLENLDIQHDLNFIKPKNGVLK
jgi:putative membrane protein